MSLATVLLIAVALPVLGFLALIAWSVFSTQRTVAMANRLPPPPGSFVEIEGSRIHYTEVGAGKPILMIHGLGGHHHHMRPLSEAFGPGYRLITLDRAGSGHSTRAPGLTGRLPEQARLIHAFIEKLELERPLLVGHSLGGAIALATALDYPQSVAGLALLSPLTQPITELRPEFRALYIPSPLRRRLTMHTVAVPLSIRHAEATLDFVFGPQKAPDDYAIEGGGLLGLRPSHLYASSTDLVAIPLDLEQQQSRYRELSMPVGIIYGTADRVLDYEIHGLRMLEQVANLDLELLEGVGHMPQYAQTERVVTFIRRIAIRAFAVDRQPTVG